MPEWIAIVLTIGLAVVALWVFMFLIAWLFTADFESAIRVGSTGTAVMCGLALFIYLLSLAIAAIWLGVSHG